MADDPDRYRSGMRRRLLDASRHPMPLSPHWAAAREKKVAYLREGRPVGNLLINQRTQLIRILGEARPTHYLMRHMSDLIYLDNQATTAHRSAGAATPCFRFWGSAL